MSSRTLYDNRDRAFTGSGMVEELKRRIQEAPDIATLRELVEVETLRQGKIHAEALLLPSPDGTASQFVQRLNFKVRDVMEKTVKDSLGIDHWGSAGTNSPLRAIVLKCAGEIIGGYIADLLTNTTFEAQVKKQIDRDLSEAMRSALSYDYKAKLAQKVQEYIITGVYPQ